MNLKNIGLQYILTNVDDENILIVLDYPSILIGIKSYMDAYSLWKWIYKRKTLQAYFSSFCYHYCVYFILFRCRGIPLHAIVSDFTSNLTENNRFISRFIPNVSQD